MTITALRAKLRRKYGNCRIGRSGMVSVYGKMPNSQTTGWYFIGWIGDIMFAANQGE